MHFAHDCLTPASGSLASSLFPSDLEFCKATCGVFNNKNAIYRPACVDIVTLLCSELLADRKAMHNWASFASPPSRATFYLTHEVLCLHLHIRWHIFVTSVAWLAQERMPRFRVVTCTVVTGYWLFKDYMLYFQRTNETDNARCSFSPFLSSSKSQLPSSSTFTCVG